MENNEINPIEELSEDKKKELQEQFAINMIASRFKSTLTDLKKLMQKNNWDLTDIKAQIENKSCSLSKNQRDFVMSYNEDFINKLLDKTPNYYARFK